MGETGLWIIVGLCLIGFGFFLYVLVAIPMMFYYKKEIEAFAKLSDIYGFEKNLGKAGLKPNFPLIKGFYKSQFFIVKKAFSKHATINYASSANTRTRKSYIQISTKVPDSRIKKFVISNKKAIKQEVDVIKFDDYMKVDLVPETVYNEIFTDELKLKLIDLAKESRYFKIWMEKDIYYTSNPNGLTKQEHVEEASHKIEVLHFITSRIKSIN